MNMIHNPGLQPVRKKLSPMQIEEIRSFVSSESVDKNARMVEIEQVASMMNISIEQILEIVGEGGVGNKNIIK